MRAVAKKAASLDWLVKGKALSLYNEYKDSVKTDIDNVHAVTLAVTAHGINIDNIRTESLGEAVYPCPYSRCGGAAMLLPLPDKIAEVYARIFGDSRIQSEAATVKVLNGTHTPNLAGDFAAYLRSQGIPKEKALTDEYVGG
ncbi:MAG: LytR family transcriptional regulator, partial [Chloroflexi bacterium]